VWAPQVVAISIALAWLYAKSGGSLLLVMLMHSAINNSKDIVVSAAAIAPGVFSPRAPLMAWLGMTESALDDVERVPEEGPGRTPGK
jgi:membrane protease YdiL (CAAX protease family)